MRRMAYAGYNGYRAGNAYFICDRCSQRFRRSAMLTEWTGLKVDLKCLDARPPQMTPPDVYPEGIPFPDARPPQDNALPVIFFVNNSGVGIRFYPNFGPTETVQFQQSQRS